MQQVIAHEEVIDFIAADSTPASVIAFRPSEAAQNRVEDLVYRSKTTGLSQAERTELNHFVKLERLMRLAKAKAHKRLKA